MFASLRTLLSGVIDYAGLFPPAKLPLEQSIRNYARYREAVENWMLGRFVCPVARLAELVSYREELFQSGKPFAFSVLGRGGKDPAEISNGVQQDLENIAQFKQRLDDRLIVDVIEIRVATGSNFWGRFRHIYQNTFIPTGNWTPYFEVVFESDWRSTVGSVIDGLASTKVFDAPGFFHPGRRCGFKLRCGGLEAAAFPTPEQVAFTIVACRDEGVPLKFTAGLHHPMRHFNEDVQTRMHGFINVFVGGALAHARRLDEEQVRAIIEDEDPRSFAFDDDGVGWKEYRATTAEITAARRNVVSFGSCSFDEPREDLRKLGWLD